MLPKGILGAALAISLLSSPVCAQTGTTTGGGAQGSMSSVNGASNGSMSSGSMMSKSHMMKKKSHMKHHHSMGGM